MCRASRQGNFSALSLWILQVHSPQLLSLSLPLGRDSSWCSVVVYFLFFFPFSLLSDLQLLLLEGCSLLGRCSRSLTVMCQGCRELLGEPGVPNLAGLPSAPLPFPAGCFPAGLFAAAALSLPPALGAAFARVLLLPGHR